MPVIINEHRFISFLRDIPSRARWALSGVICLIILSIWFTFFYLPLRAQIGGYEQEVDSLSKQIESFKKTEEQRYILEQEHTMIQNELEKKTEAMRGCSLDFILNKAYDHGLVCVALEPRNIKKRSLYETSSYEIGFKGSFQSLASYSQEFDQENRCVGIHQFEVIRDEDGDVRCSALFKMPQLIREAV